MSKWDRFHPTHAPHIEGYGAAHHVGIEIT